MSGHGRTDNLSSPIRIIVRMPEPDCFLRYRMDYGTLQPCLGCQLAALLRGILRRENSTYTYSLERTVILKWFYSLSRRKTFVEGKCALPNVLLVPSSFLIKYRQRIRVNEENI